MHVITGRLLCFSCMPSFDNVAFCYDFLSGLVFGRKLARSQTALMALLPENAHILIIGGGTGKILNSLLACKQVKQIDFVEASEKMLRKASRKCSHTAVHFVHGSENGLAASVYDVVITPYFLDLFEGKYLTSVIGKINRSLKKEGYWLYSDFYIDENPPFWQNALIKFMYQFFRLFCGIQARQLQVPDAVLGAVGLELQTEKFFMKKFIRTALWRKYKL